MKKLRKIATVLCLCLVAALSICACGKTNTKEAAEGSKNKPLSFELASGKGTISVYVDNDKYKLEANKDSKNSMSVLTPDDKVVNMVFNTLDADKLKKVKKFDEYKETEINKQFAFYASPNASTAASEDEVEHDLLVQIGKSDTYLCIIQHGKDVSVLDEVAKVVKCEIK